MKYSFQAEGTPTPLPPIAGWAANGWAGSKRVSSSLFMCVWLMYVYAVYGESERGQNNQKWQNNNT